MQWTIISCFFHRSRKWQKELGKFSLSSKVYVRLTNDIETLVNVLSDDCHEIYHCIKYNDTSYVGSDYKWVTRTDNHVALVKTDSKPVIVSIKYFILILSSGEVFGIGNEFCRLSERTIVPSWSSSQIMHASETKVLHFFM